jgi:hypothetical protein
VANPDSVRKVSNSFEVSFGSIGRIGEFRFYLWIAEHGLIVPGVDVRESVRPFRT